MTNLDYIKTLSAEELANYIYSTIITIGKQYTESRLGVANWLKEERIEIDADNQSRSNP